jgi:dihydrofolate reductase
MLHGANIFQQYLKAGLVDEINIHLVPVLFGSGKRLFEEGAEKVELKKIKVMETPGAIHLTFRVVK